MAWLDISKLSLLLISVLICGLAKAAAAKTRVVIAGAGPAGLLAAHCLLSRGDLYDVRVIEARERELSEELRSYSLGLNIRGQSAIQYFDNAKRSQGLWPAVRAAGVACDSFWLHIGKRAFRLRSGEASNEAPPTVLLPRNILCKVLLEQLQTKYGSQGRCAISHGCAVSAVDLEAKQLRTSEGETIDYDLLIGADGVRSIVRKELFQARQSAGFQCEEATLPGQFKVMVQPLEDSALDGASVHLLAPGAGGFGLFVIPGRGNLSCTLLNWKDGAEPAFLREGAAPDEVQRQIESAFPKFGRVSDDAVRQLQRQTPSDARTVRCNTYTDASGVLLLGDAAHSTGGTLGQGANSALQDVVALDAVLDATKDDLTVALPAFSRQQVKEGLALWSLLQLPPRGLVGILYAAMQLLRPLLRRVLPKWPLPTQKALSETLTPFSEIVRQNMRWMRFAKENNVTIVNPLDT